MTSDDGLATGQDGRGSAFIERWRDAVGAPGWGHEVIAALERQHRVSAKLDYRLAIGPDGRTSTEPRLLCRILQADGTVGHGISIDLTQPPPVGPAEGENLAEWTASWLASVTIPEPEGHAPLVTWTDADGIPWHATAASFP